MSQSAQTTKRTPPKRVLLKLSGEAFCAPDGFGIDTKELGVIANEVLEATKAGAQIAIVVGGGNIIRGAELAKSGDIQQATADYMGMLGTVMNAAALKEKLDSIGVDSRVLSALDIRAIAEPFIRNRAIRHLNKGRVVILAAGTGNPFFTTDTCAALRATELDCDVLLKATKVDGVYTADPHQIKQAKELIICRFVKHKPYQNWVQMYFIKKPSILYFMKKQIYPSIVVFHNQMEH